MARVRAAFAPWIHFVVMCRGTRPVWSARKGGAAFLEHVKAGRVSTFVGVSLAATVPATARRVATIVQKTVVFVQTTVASTMVLRGAAIRYVRIASAN